MTTETRLDPRVARSRVRILRATIDELAEHGYAGLTIEGVAARAGVGKATIYRHWDGKADLVGDAVEAHATPPPDADTGDLRADVLVLMQHLAERLTGDTAHLTPVLIDAAERDPQMATLHHAFVRLRRRPVVQVLQAGIARGELPSSVDLDLLADLLAAPLLYRRFVSREPVTSEFVTQVVDTVLAHPTGRCPTVQPR